MTTKIKNGLDTETRVSLWFTRLASLLQRRRVVRCDDKHKFNNNRIQKKKEKYSEQCSAEKKYINKNHHYKTNPTLLASLKI